MEEIWLLWLRWQKTVPQIRVFSALVSRSVFNEWNSKTEWHRVIAWNGLGERVAASLRKGDHVLVEGTRVSSSFEREVRKGKKHTTVKQISWSIREAMEKANQ